MKKTDFYYELPEELIAQYPAEPRDSARMLVYNRENKSIKHKIFRDIKEYLHKGDVLVINTTKVIPARLFATRPTGSAVIEVLLLKRLDYTRWEVIMKPAKKVKLHTLLHFNEELSAEFVEYRDDGIRVLDFKFEGVFEDILDRIGNIPLPPYITAKLNKPSEYQTVYSEQSGSSAAPTAGLHFTNELLEELADSGVEIVKVLLHIGLGTFRPVKADDILDHQMHTEEYEIDENACNIINNATSEGRRVICVGTTAVRVVESASNESGYIEPKKGDTNIFIYPGYNYKVVKALITNFHLPESTLIMLVSALMGREEALRMYSEAVAEQYRFFSFGDATFIE